MDPSTGHHQEMSQHSLGNMLGFSKTQQQEGERKPKPQPEQALNCPRCDSTNTKFCYYNNYSLTQPRYFCKSCRRYWTKGGTLRNVPVGGGCRKNKRCSSSSSSSKRSQDQQPLTPNSYNNTNSLLTTFPQHYYDSNDLRLAFSGLQKQSRGQLGFDDHDFSLLGNSSNTYTAITNNCTTTHPGFLDALRNGFIESHNNFQNLNYGFGNGNVGSEVENSTSSACGVSGEMGLPIYDQEIRNVATTSNAVTVTTMKQEICNGRSESNENKVLWGFPWQLSGEANMGHHDFDNGRDQSWNGIASSWHGLLNTTPLM